MKIAIRLVITLVTVAALGACTQSPTTPSSPPPSNLQSPSLSLRDVASGQITLQSIAPGSGSTLTVHECSTSFIGSQDLCAGSARLAVDVEFGRDVSSAVVTAGFSNSMKQCGVLSSRPSPLAAGTRASFELLGAIELSDESVQLQCLLPAQTTRMVVQLWEASQPAQPLLTRQFEHSYTFTGP
jgi:hypothetical protein